MTTDSGVSKAGPLAVSDADHMACVEVVKSLEGICIGCSWLQDPCP